MVNDLSDKVLFILDSVLERWCGPCYIWVQDGIAHDIRLHEFIIKFFNICIKDVRLKKVDILNSPPPVKLTFTTGSKCVVKDRFCCKGSIRITARHSYYRMIRFMQMYYYLHTIFNGDKKRIQRWLKRVAIPTFKYKSLKEVDQLLGGLMAACGC